jgi:hypothetical protein
MAAHEYRITVEHLKTQREGDPLHAPLTFEAGNHDDVFAIVERMRARQEALGLAGDEVPAMAIGLKLLSEIALAHRKEALFAPLSAALGEFIGTLKNTPAP